MFHINMILSSPKRRCQRIKLSRLLVEIKYKWRFEHKSQFCATPSLAFAGKRFLKKCLEYLLGSKDESVFDSQDRTLQSWLSAKPGFSPGTTSRRRSARRSRIPGLQIFGPSDASCPTEPISVLAAGLSVPLLLFSRRAPSKVFF